MLIHVQATRVAGRNGQFAGQATTNSISGLPVGNVKAIRLVILMGLLTWRIKDGSTWFGASKISPLRSLFVAISKFYSPDLVSLPPPQIPTRLQATLQVGG